MNIAEAIKHRKSCRAFLDKPVDPETVAKILEIARWAPSGVNHQPAQVAVLGPETRQKLTQGFLNNFRSGAKPNPDYDPPAKEWSDVYKKRRKACGVALYNAVHINLEDKDARTELWERNYDFFHAPVAMIVYIDKNMPKSSWIDIGIFIQSVLIAAEEFGLSSCPQAAFSDYPDVVRQTLNLENVDIICGIALGIEDTNHPLNSYRTEREEVNTFTHWYS